MPFCDIDQDLSLHYVTNTPKGNATDLDLTKPTIILLPPIFFNVETWLREQFKDPRLSEPYNLIAFDLRNMGSTKAPLCPERDSWVDAADLGVAHEKLQLPPCHLFAVVMLGCEAALRFAALFPSKCLSLCLCGVTVMFGEYQELVAQGFREFTEAYCFPEDMDTLERAYMELLWLAFSGQISPELTDEVVAWLQVNLPPTKRTKFIGQRLSIMQLVRLSEKEVNAIQQPAIFIQGDKSLFVPPGKTTEPNYKLPNARVFVLKGGPHLFNFIPEYASVVNRVYSRFLATLSEETPTIPLDPGQPDPCRVCKAGLARLAVFADDSSIINRDPSNTLSFSRLAPQMVEQNVATFAEFATGESEAFTALDEHGQPKRKFSERHIDEWMPAAFQRMQAHRSAEETDVAEVAVVQTSISQD